MNCEIAGCEEVATHRINGIGNACACCKNEVIADLEIDEEDEVNLL
ncbi:hypothetical protein [Paenibacillus sp. Soil724D2]|nr:hypothetical protein [Paenibacillus sp. Soil724D2]